MKRLRQYLPFVLILTSVVLLVWASRRGSMESSGQISPGPTPASTNGDPALSTAPWYTYEVVHVWPHDRTAFTEGLVFHDGALFESTGLEGHSRLRKIELETGHVLQELEVPPEYFGEGLAILNEKAYQLTYTTDKAFVYDLKTFKKEGEFFYEGEGWGLTTDGKSLIMSDGTEHVRFRDPANFSVQRTIDVTLNGQTITNVNELEYIKGEIYANVWKTPDVLRIDPASGKVVGVIDFSGLLTKDDFNQPIDVMNGIAYDAAGDRLFVTGKWWPKVFEVRIKPRAAQ